MEVSGLWSIEKTIVYVDKDEQPHPFKYIAYAETKEAAAMTLYIHWVIQMMAKDFEIPGARYREEGE